MALVHKIDLWKMLANVHRELMIENPRRLQSLAQDLSNALQVAVDLGYPKRWIDPVDMPKLCSSSAKIEAADSEPDTSARSDLLRRAVSDSCLTASTSRSIDATQRPAKRDIEVTILKPPAAKRPLAIRAAGEIGQPSKRMRIANGPDIAEVFDPDVIDMPMAMVTKPEAAAEEPRYTREELDEWIEEGSEVEVAPVKIEVPKAKKIKKGKGRKRGAPSASEATVVAVAGSQSQNKFGTAALEHSEKNQATEKRRIRKKPWKVLATEPGSSAFGGFLSLRQLRGEPER